ncbi:colicin E3/pyocin S6 family cytotoxin [Pseudomonas fragi]|uniref:colicin E3/pyocin S6 family cytotoxin n=1 Tax=Pseudomonas fragi TaxID=296 RepID=UPI003917DEF8
MGGIARPRPSIVDCFKKDKVEGGRQYYFDPSEQRYYSWDSLHGEFEVFDKRGYHLGSVCPKTGITLKPPVRGRRFNPN